MAASEEIFRPYPHYTPMTQLLFDMLRGRVRAQEYRMPIGQAMADVQEIRPALIVSVARQLREARAELGRDQGDRDLRERAAALEQVDQALKRGWPVNELSALKAIGVKELVLDSPIAGAGLDRLKLLSRAIEWAISELPERQRRSVLDGLRRSRGET